MRKDKTFIAVIPARGGSKRVENKNLRLLCGKPLIQWTIEEALKSDYINKTVVTSDSKEILDLAKNLGIESLKRPASLSGDSTTTFDAVNHAIENTQGDYDYIILLQPTSPLRTSIDVDMAIDRMFEKGADGIVSVCEVDHSPLWCNTLPENGDMTGFVRDDVRNIRSQDLPRYYRINGAIYVTEIKSLLSQKTFFLNTKLQSYVMPRDISIDIDEEIDLVVASTLLEMRNN